MSCSICNNSKIIIQAQELKLCSCVLQNCQCDGIAPYLFYDETTSKTETCSCAVHRRKFAHVLLLFSLSNLPERYKFQKLENYKTPTAEQQNIKNRSQHLIDNFKNKPKGFLLFGQPGTGKTFITCLIANELILKNIETKFIKISRDFFNRLRETYNQESKKYGQTEKIFKEIADTEVLILDDFGIQANSDWEILQLYNLIDSRYEAQKLTFITTNKKPKDFESLFDGRIYSRLAEMTNAIHLSGADLRLPQNQKILFEEEK